MDPSRNGNHPAADTAADATAGVASPRDQAVEPAARVGGGQEQLLHYCGLAADTIGRFADGIEGISVRMREDEATRLSAQMAGIVDGLRRLSSGLRGQDAGQLLRDAQRLAREYPALLVAGGIAAGLGLALSTRPAVAEASAPGDRLRMATAEPDGRDRRSDADATDACSAAPTLSGAGDVRD